MICNKCKFENEKSAKFCRKCGWELGKEIFINNDKTRLKEQIDLLGIFGLIIVCLSLSQTMFRYFLYDFYFVLRIIFFLSSSIPFVMSFFVNRKLIKIILMILGGVNIIFQLRYFF